MNIREEYIKICKEFNIDEPNWLKDTLKQWFRQEIDLLLTEHIILFTNEKHITFLNLETVKAPLIKTSTSNFNMEEDVKYAVCLYGEEKNEIIRELENKGVDKVIDIYDDVRFKKNFIFSYPIYNYMQIKDYTYNSLVEMYHKYCEEPKSENMLQLIYKFFIYRDFSSSLFYMNEYIIRKEKNFEQVALLKRKTEELIHNAREIISARNQKDIILNWIDQLCYQDLDQCEYLSEIAKNSWFFEKAYTATPYTKPTIRYIFFKEKILDSEFKIFLPNRYKSAMDSSLFRMLKKSGYNIKILAPNEGEYTWLGEKDVSETNMPATLRYWKLVEEITSSEKPLFALVDTLRETHEPFWNPFIEKYVGMQLFKTNYEEENVKKQISDSIKYMDVQMRFYMELFKGDNQVKIYMSDHGKWNEISDRRYYDRAVHSLFFVQGGASANIPTKSENGIFRLSNLDKLIRTLVYSDNPKLFSKYAFIQDVQLYNSDLVRAMKIRGDVSDEISLAFRGMIFEKKYKYVLLEDGRELFFILPNETINEIDNPQYIEEIQYARRKISKKFKNNIFLQRVKKIYVLFQYAIEVKSKQIKATI